MLFKLLGTNKDVSSTDFTSCMIDASRMWAVLSLRMFQLFYALLLYYFYFFIIINNFNNLIENLLYYLSVNNVVKFSHK